MTQVYLGVPDLSLRHLKAALFVAQQQNLTRAAEQLNRSQTAITKGIGELEQRLGVKLFERSASGMRCTPHGEALVKRVEAAAAEFTSAGQAFAEHQERDQHVLKLPVFSMDISYKRLAAFLALYRARDINMAADWLGVTRAALHNSISALEDLLGLVLFERSPGGIACSSYCHILARHVKLAFAQLRHALDDIASIDGNKRGHLAIGTLPYTRTILTPLAIDHLLSEHPNFDVSVIEGSYTQLEAMLRSGEIDMIVGAIREEPGNGLSAEAVFEDEILVASRSDHPLAGREIVSFEEAMTYPWILPLSQSRLRSLFNEACSEAGVKPPRHPVETSSLFTVRGLLLNSDRLALLSAHQIHYDQESNALTTMRLAGRRILRPIGYTQRVQAQPSKVSQLFIESLHAVADQADAAEDWDLLADASLSSA